MKPARKHVRREIAGEHEAAKPWIQALLQESEGCTLPRQVQYYSIK